MFTFLFIPRFLTQPKESPLGGKSHSLTPLPPPQHYCKPILFIFNELFIAALLCCFGFAAFFCCFVIGS